jgi:hypothetical protein
MPSDLSWDEALNQVQHSFMQMITATLKLLLESKHLYQSATVQPSPLLDSFLKRVHESHTGYVVDSFSESIRANWFPIDKSSGNTDWGKQLAIQFVTPDVKLFCETCYRVQAFNSIRSADLLWQEPLTNIYALSGSTVQIFGFSFLCQSCKSVPEAFLVRRQGMKLTNSGRSPIEHVDVPIVCYSQAGEVLLFRCPRGASVRPNIGWNFPTSDLN